MGVSVYEIEKEYRMNIEYIRNDYDISNEGYNSLQGLIDEEINFLFGHDMGAPVLRNDWEELVESSVNRRSPMYVRWVQRSLNKLLGINLAEDGIVGRNTRRAIRRFQKRAGLVPDGIAGSRTERALIAAGANPIPDFTTAGRAAACPNKPAVKDKSCPVRAKVTKKRCKTSNVCPAIPDLLCTKGVKGIPFELKIPSNSIICFNSLINVRQCIFIVICMILFNST